MVILGIDPGYATIGYGVIKKTDNGISVIDYGVVLTPKDECLPVRLSIIYESINAIIDKFKPDEIAMEELFFAKNAKTGIQVAHARGVIALSCIHKCGLVYEYTPLQIKQALTGNGRAQKLEVENMVKAVLEISEKIKPDDAADALAVAICHSNVNKNLNNKFLF